MKKGQIYEGTVERLDFPNKGILNIEETRVIVKNVLPGQKIRFSINKKRKDRCEGRVLEVLQASPLETALPPCKNFGACGGCSYQSIPYEEQLKLKESQVKRLLATVCNTPYSFEGIKRSPSEWAYRNKMEFSFGDEYKDGPLALGLHKRGSFHDIITASDCKIVHADYNLVLNCVLSYFAERKVDFYHKLSHEGFLRHLLIRRAAATGELLVDIVTTSQSSPELEPLVSHLLALPLEGKIVGILHTLNDSLADTIQSDRTDILYGQDFYYEKLLNLTFKISVFSFFQTNSLGAEVLYQTAREYIGDTNNKLVFDLYSGTGTIAQILAPVSKKVIGVEIVEEAARAARENAKLNNLTNCDFIAGDVLKVMDQIAEKPDLLILDPPREGIHPKALEKIIGYGVERLVYISCKPTSLVRDLAIFQENGYRMERACCVDMFPETVHVETVVMLSKKN